jgi:putative membrane protein
MKTPFRFMVSLLFLLAVVSGCGCGMWPNGGRMLNFGCGGNSMFMGLLFLAVIGILIYFFIQASKSGKFSGSSTETPLEILKKRYAKGEIGKEEYEKIKQDLQA